MRKIAWIRAVLKMGAHQKEITRAAAEGRTHLLGVSQCPLLKILI
jgi:hypothetical protein